MGLICAYFSFSYSDTNHSKLNEALSHLRVGGLHLLIKDNKDHLCSFILSCAIYRCSKHLIMKPLFVVLVILMIEDIFITVQGKIFILKLRYT